MAMTPQEKSLMQTLEKRVRDLEQATNPAFIAELVRRLGGITVVVEDGASSTGTTVAVRNATDTGSETVADAYTGVLTVTSGGQTYRVGYY